MYYRCIAIISVSDSLLLLLDQRKACYSYTVNTVQVTDQDIKHGIVQ